MGLQTSSRKHCIRNASLSPHLEPTDSESLCEGPAIWIVTKPWGGTGVLSSLRTTDVSKPYNQNPLWVRLDERMICVDASQLQCLFKARNPQPRKNSFPHENFRGLLAQVRNACSLATQRLSSGLWWTCREAELKKTLFHPEQESAPRYS